MQIHKLRAIHLKAICWWGKWGFRSLVYQEQWRGDSPWWFCDACDTQEPTATHNFLSVVKSVILGKQECAKCCCGVSLDWSCWVKESLKSGTKPGCRGVFSDSETCIKPRLIYFQGWKTKFKKAHYKFLSYEATTPYVWVYRLTCLLLRASACHPQEQIFFSLNMKRFHFPKYFMQIL